MNFAMDFQFAGPTNLPYVRGPQPVPPAQHVKAVDPAYGQNCQGCLRTALGCGSAPNLEELDRCQAMARGVEAVLHRDCTLQARVYSAFPAGAASSQCADLCALNPDLQYGSGYARPFVDAAGPGSVTM
jgi:hypothetical protein